MPKRNESIGTVECSHKGCTEQCSVFRFRERGETEKSIANRRFAGRLYGRCPKHGRFGGDPGEQEVQEYILANAKMHAPGAVDRQPAPAKAPASPNKSQSQNVRPPARSPANAPARSPAAKVSNGWNWPWE